MSHKLLNYAFMLFWNIFGVIDREFFFLVNKVSISETTTDKLRVCFSYHVWKGANPKEYLVLFKQFFLIKPVKREKY